MRVFTVKDFIAYNNPCFSCGSKINFRIGTMDMERGAEPSYLRALVAPNYTEIDLLITYNDSLKLYIFHKTNKILTNNVSALTDYLTRRKLFLSSTCDKCFSMVESHYLEFNQDKSVIKAVGLTMELLQVTDGESLFQLHSSFVDNKSNLTVSKVGTVTPIKLEMPLLPLYKIKTKKHFLEKMKTYLIFS
jgi:hypothetical protein